MEILSLLIGIAVLILLSYKGVATYLSAMISSVIILILSGMNVWTGMSEVFAGGFVGFIKSYILILTLGAMFGRLMSASGSAKSFALTLLRVFGETRILAVIIVASIVMCLCGINVYIIFFAVYPIAVIIGKKQNIHKGVLALAIFCIAFVSGFPGVISLNNIVGSTMLGTKLTAAPLIGIIGSLVTFSICLFFTYYYARKYKRNDLGFEAGPKDHLYLGEDMSDDTLPHWSISVIPLIVVAVLSLVLSNVFNLDPVFAVVIALLISSLLIILLNFKRLKGSLSETLGDGLMDGFGPLLTISALVGFGAVVKTTEGFGNILNAALSMNADPYMSTFLGTNLFVGITGSMSGGLTIFMDTLAQNYVEMGGNADAIHRIAAMSAMGLDSLPHSAGIIGQLAVMQLTVKNGYKYAFLQTVVATLAGAFVTTVLAMIFY